jgi:outer membrane lipoprotein-sorting protein
MNKIIFLLFLFFTGLILFISCKKESSQQGYGVNNKPPVANAGADQAIATDTVLLDGSASNDPDGTIAEWRWIKISGPSFIISNANVAKPVAKNIATGVYQFELTVIDNGGLSTKDTVQIGVNIPNRPPVAKAGADQTITLPVNTLNLDGTSSTDPDNNITGYRWTKISGPVSFSIANGNVVQAQLMNLTTGFYQFELKVTDAGGLFNSDTMQVTVQPEPVSVCNVGTRPVVTAQLIPIGTLGRPRGNMAVASAGNKIVFAGGFQDGPVFGFQESGFVDIYDLSNQTWSTASLSNSRSNISAVANGNKIFFAGGGYIYADNYSSNVDIYDVLTNTWTVTALSEPKTLVAAATFENKVMFAGGYKVSADYTSIYAVSTVDIYDLSANSWSIKQLSEARGGISAVTGGNKVYFAGGSTDVAAGVSNKIDIYDNTSNSWSVSALNFIAAPRTGYFVTNKIYWAGSGCSIEARNINTGTSTSAFLSKPDAGYTVIKNGQMIFFRPQSAQFDIYGLATDNWSIGVLPQPIPHGASIIAVNNKIYVAGGVPVNSNTLSNTVYRLEF